MLRGLRPDGCVGWAMAKCERCDREECAREATNWAWWKCRCDESVDRCVHHNANREAIADCEAHRVNWRERALKAEARQAWVPVGERLPDNGEMVAVWLGGIDTGFLNDGVWYIRPSAGPHGGGGYNPTRKITHWRPIDAPPLPAAPEVE